MKTTCYLLSLAMGLCIFTTACKKNTEPVIKPDNAVVRIGGADYPIVKIGSQSWTAQNYAGEGGVELEPQNRVPQYAKYYTQAEALAIPLPAGWRLPTVDDVKKLCRSQSIELPDSGFFENGQHIRPLMARGVWINDVGTNASKLNLYPAGYVYYGLEVGQGKVSRFWTATTLDRNKLFFAIRCDTAAFNCRVTGFINDRWIPVRFVKDE